MNYKWEIYHSGYDSVVLGGFAETLDEAQSKASLELEKESAAYPLSRIDATIDFGAEGWVKSSGGTDWERAE